VTENSLEACIRAWRHRHALDNGLSAEHLGDGHFTRGEFEAAAVAYATCEPETDQIRAKRGWCLAVLDRFDEAEQLLTPATCGTSSAELAVLAAIVAGGWNRNKLYAASGTQGDDARARSEQVAQLVDRALRSTDKPDYLAFIAYKDLIGWHRDREAALVVAERAVSLFKTPDLAEWHARSLRWLRRPTNAALDALLEQMPEAPWSTYLAETFESALALPRYDDACVALDVLGEKLKSERDPTFPIGLSLMRSYVDLRRALDADPGAAVRGLAAVENVSRDLPTISTRHSWTDGPRLFADKLRLALAVILKDERAVREVQFVSNGQQWARHSKSSVRDEREQGSRVGRGEVVQGD
jgi:hypothetical protein